MKIVKLMALAFVLLNLTYCSEDSNSVNNENGNSNITSEPFSSTPPPEDTLVVEPRLDTLIPVDTIPFISTPPPEDIFIIEPVLDTLIPFDTVSKTFLTPPNPQKIPVIDTVAIDTISLDSM